MSYRSRIFAISHTVLALFALGEAIGIGAEVEPYTHLTGLPTTIDAKCRERFLSEAAPAWKKQRERLRGFELELTYIEHVPVDHDEPNPKPMVSTYRILQDGVSRRLDRGSRIDITNGRYSFSVSGSAHPYSLRQCELWQQGAPQPLAGWLDIAELNLAMGSNIWWVPIEKVMASDDFRMTGADRAVNDAGEEVIRIVYRYTGERSGDDFSLEPDGIYWAELLPARFWSVMRSGMAASMTKSLSDMPIQARVTTHYQEWNGVPLPEEVRIETKDLRRNVIVRVQENRIGAPRRDSRPMEEFFLPFFGLSDDPLPSMPATCSP